MVNKYSKRNELLKSLSGALLFFGTCISLASFLRLGMGCPDPFYIYHSPEACVGCIIGILFIGVTVFIESRYAYKKTYSILKGVMGCIGAVVFMLSMILLMVGAENDIIPNTGLILGVVLIFLSIVVIGIYLKSKKMK